MTRIHAHPTPASVLGEGFRAGTHFPNTRQAAAKYPPAAVKMVRKMLTSVEVSYATFDDICLLSWQHLEVSIISMSGSTSPDESNPMLAQFEDLARRRRATRHFSQQPLERELIERLLRISQWAPSGYNLQPTRFVVIADPSIRLCITRACMNQQPIKEAPIVIVFAGDHRAFARLEETLNSDLAAAAITPEYANFLRKIVRLMFKQGPLGINWLWKATLIPIARVFVPIPQMMAVHKRFWLAKQVMLCAMNFMLAAEAAGLGTVPMEGFDAGRLRRSLDLPRSWEPILVVPVGYAKTAPARKTRLPLQRVILWR